MKTAIKAMQARFPGRCPRCRGEIRPGEEIVYVTGRGAFHPACTAKPAATAPAIKTTAQEHEIDPRTEADRLRARIDFDALRAINTSLEPVWIEEFTAHSGFGPGFWPAVKNRLAEAGLDPRGLRAAVRKACGEAAEVVLADLDGRRLSTSIKLSVALSASVAFPARQALGRVARYWSDLTKVVIALSPKMEA
jgi:hypothetical protein